MMVVITAPCMRDTRDDGSATPTCDVIGIVQYELIDQVLFPRAQELERSDEIDVFVVPMSLKEAQKFIAVGIDQFLGWWFRHLYESVRWWCCQNRVDGHGTCGINKNGDVVSFITVIGDILADLLKCANLTRDPVVARTLILDSVG